ncbi:Transcriptional adapter 1 [Geodia barretti]|uniref:Transcriptional adapter 1 n=1 Tax=Geodia barretti TaxID=519541 RepID=A0AA35R1K5_GEOBA|nr:Transcriptional adapter 1 [Geodia barretti]
MADLEGAKGRLVEALKERTARYWELMKSWYRRRIAKEDFDTKARGFLGDDNVHLHNEFLFAILVKCQTGLQPPERVVSPPLEPIPYGALDVRQYQKPPTVQVVGRDLDTLLLCSHELLLPDRPTLHTRMLLLAWEAGLDGVSEEAADLLLLALENHLKNVLQTLIAHMSTWQTRTGGQFQHSFGNSSSGCGLTRSRCVPECRYEGDRREAVSAMLAAQSTLSADEGKPISLFHFRDALMLNRSSIPVHSLLVCNMERALAGMWHPELEEERQRQEVEHWNRTHSLQTGNAPSL